MPESLINQLEQAIDIRLQKGAQRHEYGSYLFPVSLLQEWHEARDIRSVFRGMALEEMANIEVISQQAREVRYPWPFNKKLIGRYPQYRLLKVGVLPYGSSAEFRMAHTLILEPGKNAILTNIVGESRRLRKIEAQKMEQADWEYFYQFIDRSLAFPKGTFRVTR